MSLKEARARDKRSNRVFWWGAVAFVWLGFVGYASWTSTMEAKRKAWCEHPAYPTTICK